MAQQAGIQQASGPLEDLQKGVTSLAEMFGGQVRAARRGAGLAAGPGPRRCGHARAVCRALGPPPVFCRLRSSERAASLLP
jgi:hypothetical protein